jgi:hypothetical protein
MGHSIVEKLSESHPVISCEGTAEQVIIEKLLAADALVFSRDAVLDVTRKRRAADIQEQYLNYDYDWPVCVMRILDSRRENFELGRLYRDRFEVVNVYTHPEIEILAVIREGAWHKWSKSGKRPSEYCKQDLRLREIKSREFLDDYWDAESIARAAFDYRRLSYIAKEETCLADIVMS